MKESEASGTTNGGAITGHAILVAVNLATFIMVAQTALVRSTTVLDWALCGISLACGIGCVLEMLRLRREDRP